MTPTNRTFTEVGTNFNYRLYTSKESSVYHLIAEGQHEQIADGCEVNGFYLLAHTAGTIKINGKTQIKLNMGQFYNLKEGEKVTHVKYLGFDKFKKLP